MIVGWVDAKIFKSENHIIKMTSIVKTIQTRFNSTEPEFDQFFVTIEENRQWMTDNIQNIEEWLDGEIEKLSDPKRNNTCKVTAIC